MLKIRISIGFLLILMILGMNTFTVAYAQGNDSDGDGFNDNVDECPNVRGTARGCPDGDGDGFHDREDECPNVAGTIRGCLDSDGDGRPDVIDDCPNIPGSVRGCPDLDGDGFHILEDECPNEFGTVRGCPDGDGDGRPDIIDDCPNTPGTLNGCPDTDGDGFHDREDECPNVAGTIRGCVDTDGDGRPDVIDDCPSVAGTIRGCPPTVTPQPTSSSSQNTPQSTPTPTPTEMTNNVSSVTSSSACELISTSSDAILIHQTPSADAEIIGLFDDTTEYVVYGIIAPENWYWLDLGWIQGDLVTTTGNCGNLVGFDMPILGDDTQATINIADIDIPRAQIACSYVIELEDTFCFYQIPMPNDNDETRTMICILQSGVLNCEAGYGLLFALLQDSFGADIITSKTDETTTSDVIMCSELMREFLRPAIENEPIRYSVIENYVVGFVNPADFAFFELRSCLNQVEYITPLVENNEVMTDFMIQSINTQYDLWRPFGGDDISGYIDGVPVVALLAPDFQKSEAKKGLLATTPIWIDFLNKVILFGDGHILFGFNTMPFYQQVQLLTGIDFSQ
jgi:hypothetical protein